MNDLGIIKVLKELSKRSDYDSVIENLLNPGRDKKCGKFPKELTQCKNKSKKKTKRTSKHLFIIETSEK